MGWRDWLGWGQRKKPASAAKYRQFFDGVKYANDHNMSVLQALRHVGFETDLFRILTLYDNFAVKRLQLVEDTLSADLQRDIQQPDVDESGQPWPAQLNQVMSTTALSITRLAYQNALLTIECANFPKTMEGDNISLSQLWAEMVIRHYNELAACAKFVDISITGQQAPRLLRQVTCFYDTLWWYRLHQRILDVGQIPSDQVQLYVEEYKEAIRVALLMHRNMPLASEDMSIFTNPEEMKEDYDFYVHGKLATEYYATDYLKTLDFLKIERDGTIQEWIGRLHFRTIQVLDLSHKMTLMEMNWWWRLQSDLAIENLENVINKIVPIPSSHAPD